MRQPTPVAWLRGLLAPVVLLTVTGPVASRVLHVAPVLGSVLIPHAAAEPPLQRCGL